MSRFACSALIAFMVVLVPAAEAVTWHVPADFTTIAGACGLAAAGDTVVVACGVYPESDIVVPAGIVLRSEDGSPDCAVVDALQGGRVLDCNGADGTTIEGLTLRGGTGDGGGCVRISGGSLRFVNCEISGGDSGGSGGGVLCFGGATVFDGCRFLDNSAPYGSGGGLYAGDGAAPVLRDCLFEGNFAQSEGGGMFVDNGALDLVDCDFVGNSTGNYGGGLLAYGSAGTLTGCEFRDNVAQSGGGGAHVAWAPVEFVSTTFSGNEAVALSGGGLSTGGYDRITLTDCLVTANRAHYSAGIRIGSDMSLVRCTITGNEAVNTFAGIGMNGGLHLDALQCTIRDNVGPAPTDGYVPQNSTALLRCCEIVAAQWYDWGAITVDDEGCGVPAAPSTWGGLKSLYR